MTFRARQAAQQRQQASDRAQLAYAEVTTICAAVEARMASHKADGLATFCAAYAGHSNTVKTAILRVIERQLGRESRDEVREALPLT